MNRKCGQCGKTAEREDMLFCPYCGAKLSSDGPAGAAGSGQAEGDIPAEARKWLEKAAREQVVPKRKAILLKAREKYPDCFPIEWELLFTGEDKKSGQRPGSYDFSVIKCYLLKMYQKPDLFSEERKEADRMELFGGPQLVRCLSMSGDPAGKTDEYLYRLCRDYIEIFLEEDRELTGGLLGFRREKNHEKLIAGQAAVMVRNMRRDPGLTAEQRGLLEKAFLRAYSDRFGGKTENLDAKLGT